MADPEAELRQNFSEFFQTKLSRAAHSEHSGNLQILHFLARLGEIYPQTETGSSILGMLQRRHPNNSAIKIRIGALALTASTKDNRRVFDLMKRLKVGGLAIFGTIYLPADFLKTAARSPVYAWLLFSHELIHVLYRHDFPRMTLTTEAWAYWHEFKLFAEWQAAGIIPPTMPPMGGARRGLKIHQALEADQLLKPNSPFWKPALVNDLIGKSYDWYRGFGRIRRLFLKVVEKFSRGKSFRQR